MKKILILLMVLAVTATAFAGGKGEPEPTKGYPDRALLAIQDELTGEKLAEILMKYMDDPAALGRMATCAHKMNRLNAASHIVDQLLEMAGGRCS